MTETPAPYHAEPQQDLNELPEIPDTPRITPGNLEEITIPAGGGTLAKYTLKDGERYARLEDLTQEEQNAALAFLLRYSPPIVARKPHRHPAPCPGKLLEFDPAPLDAILNDAPKKRGPKTKKCEIWMNGKYLETCRNRETAELLVKHYQNQEKHEEQEGYKPVKTTYEIKPYKGKPEP